MRGRPIIVTTTPRTLGAASRGSGVPRQRSAVVGLHAPGDPVLSAPPAAPNPAAPGTGTAAGASSSRKNDSTSKSERDQRASDPTHNGIGVKENDSSVQPQPYRTAAAGAGRGTDGNGGGSPGNDGARRRQGGAQSSRAATSGNRRIVTFCCSASAPPAGAPGSGAAHAPAIVIGASSIEPQRTLPRRSMSLPIICSVSNIVFRFTGDGDFLDRVHRLAFSTQKPAAPASNAGDGVDAVAHQFGDDQAGAHRREQFVVSDGRRLDPTMTPGTPPALPVVSRAGGPNTNRARSLRTPSQTSPRSCVATPRRRGSMLLRARGRCGRSWICMKSGNTAVPARSAESSTCGTTRRRGSRRGSADQAARQLRHEQHRRRARADRRAPRRHSIALGRAPADRIRGFGRLASRSLLYQ